MASLKLPEYGQHIIFLGATGSGKTFFAEKLLSHYHNYFAVDVQDGLDLPGNVITTPKLLKFNLKWHDKIRYTPKPEYVEKDSFDTVFRTLLESSTKKNPKPKIIYIDEIFFLGYGFMNFPRWLVKSIPTARQRKLSYWISTQEPKNIPGNMLSQASKIYVFSLAKLDHIKYVSTFAGEGVKELANVLQEIRKEDEHGFVEIDNRKGTWSVFPKIKA